MRKRLLVAVIAAVMAIVSVLGLVACDGGGDDTDPNKLASPTNFTFDTNTGAYAFDSVENGQFYYIVIVKYDSNGNEYTDIVGMTSMIPGTGRLTGTVEIRKFSDNNTILGDLMSVKDLPKANYGAKCIATASGYTNSDPAIFKFNIGGKLEFPKTTFTVKDGKLTATPACFYMEDCLWFNGVPEKVEMYVRNKTTNELITTLTFDDWSYTNKFLAYKIFYLFDNAVQEYTLPNGLTAADIIVTAKAIGNGTTTTDSDEVPAWEREAFERITDERIFWTPDPAPGWDSFWDEYKA